jgi:hypothetical protein
MSRHSGSAGNRARARSRADRRAVSARRSAAVIGAMLFATACGGSSSPKAATSAASSTSPTTPPTANAPTTTTTVAASAGDQKLAKAAVLTLDDLGAQWKLYKPAAGVVTYPASDCTARLVVPLAHGASQSGMQAKFAANDSYVVSRSVVFPSRNASSAYIALRNTPAFITCLTKQYEDGLRKGNPTYRAVASTLSDPTVGHNGYVDFRRYEVQSRDATGKYETVGSYDQFLYRQGRVVIVIELDRAGGPNDANARAVLATMDGAIAHAIIRIESAGG